MAPPSRSHTMAEQTILELIEPADAGDTEAEQQLLDAFAAVLEVIAAD